MSPSSAAAGAFPHVHELGLQRLRENFDLVPVEYPSTRVQSSAAKRAYDLMDAFTDDSIKEEMPSGEYVFRTLRNLFERGILEQLSALIVARPISEEFGVVGSDETVIDREEDHRLGIIRALKAYHPNLPFVFGVDAGHTDPQLVLPLGGTIEVDMLLEQIHVVY